MNNIALGIDFATCKQKGNLYLFNNRLRIAPPVTIFMTPYCKPVKRLARYCKH